MLKGAGFTDPDDGFRADHAICSLGCKSSSSMRVSRLNRSRNSRIKTKSNEDGARASSLNFYKEKRYMFASDQSLAEGPSPKTAMDHLIADRGDIFGYTEICAFAYRRGSVF